MCVCMMYIQENEQSYLAYMEFKDHSHFYQLNHALLLKAYKANIFLFQKTILSQVYIQERKFLILHTCTRTS